MLDIGVKVASLIRNYMYFPTDGLYYSLNVKEIAQDSKNNNVFLFLVLCHDVQSFIIKVLKVGYKSFTR